LRRRRPGAAVGLQVWVTETDKQPVRSTVTLLQAGSLIETLEVRAGAGTVETKENGRQVMQLILFSGASVTAR
jgi:hypothetical protein